MKVKFQYRISGKVKNFTGEITGEGKDYDATVEDAYQNVCNQEHNPFLTITFKRMN